MNDAILARLQTICLALPETCEIEAWGHPTFRAGQKIFVTYGSHEERHSMSFKADEGEQGLYLQDPRFYRPAYVGHKGWVGMWLDTATDWQEVAHLETRSYRLIALKRMVKALDARIPV